jgi:hypothetical protein
MTLFICSAAPATVVERLDMSAAASDRAPEIRVNQPRQFAHFVARFHIEAFGQTPLAAAIRHYQYYRP